MKSSDGDTSMSVGGGTPMSIGEVARRFDLATHVLRHWESVGLLFPERVAGDRRRYGTDQLYRIPVILRARQAGLSLDEIRGVLNEREPGVRRALLQQRREDLLGLIERAKASLAMIDCALDCAHEDFTRCATFQASIAADVTGRPVSADRVGRPVSADRVGRPVSADRVGRPVSGDSVGSAVPGVGSAVPPAGCQVVAR